MEPISIFDILKIGVGPSSSHTMGPWKAATLFLHDLESKNVFDRVISLKVDLYGSLALTGRGHGTDKALLLGLSGYAPENIPLEEVVDVPESVRTEARLSLAGRRSIEFDEGQCICFHPQKQLDFHPNGMIISAFGEGGEALLTETYFSIGGGFVVYGEDLIPASQKDPVVLPFPIESAQDLEQYCLGKNRTIADIVLQNELVWRPKAAIEEKALAIWQVMKETIFRGCQSQGVLPGGLNVARRAAPLHQKLTNGQYFDNQSDWEVYLKHVSSGFEKTLKFVSCFAIATNEENAGFGRVVTAPTNGAAGVIPAVLMYYVYFSSREDIGEREIIDFLFVAGEIGSIFKKRATISAAMGGCQAEIGVSSAMAAAALTAGLGGSVDQALMAAEIAMEHHLGLTCDPIGGLVQIPCIERNSMGAIKAITASQIALESNPQLAKVSLDTVIKTMWETALDMNSKYKETSLGGLASHIAVSNPEC